MGRRHADSWTGCAPCVVGGRQADRGKQRANLVRKHHFRDKKPCVEWPHRDLFSTRCSSLGQDGSSSLTSPAKQSSSQRHRERSSVERFRRKEGMGEDPEREATGLSNRCQLLIFEKGVTPTPIYRMQSAEVARCRVSHLPRVPRMRCMVIKLSHNLSESTPFFSGLPAPRL